MSNPQMAYLHLPCLNFSPNSPNMSPIFWCVLSVRIFFNSVGNKVEFVMYADISKILKFL